MQSPPRQMLHLTLFQVLNHEQNHEQNNTYNLPLSEN